MNFDLTRASHAGWEADFVRAVQIAGQEKRESANGHSVANGSGHAVALPRKPALQRLQEEKRREREKRQRLENDRLAKFTEADEGAEKAPVPPPIFDPWEDTTAPALTPFPMQVLPAWLQDHVTFVSRNTGVDKSAIAFLHLAAFVTALDHASYAAMSRNYDRRVYPIVWAAVLAPSGDGKSPALRHATKPFEIHERLLMADYKQQMADWESNGSNGPKPIRVSVMVTDATGARLVSRLAEQGRRRGGVVLINEEMTGWLATQELGGSDRPLWLKAADGGLFNQLRVTRGDSDVEHLAVSILTGMQPAKLFDLARPRKDNTSPMTDDGLLQRINMVVCAPQVMPEDVPHPGDASLYSDSIRAILNIPRCRIDITEKAATAWAMFQEVAFGEKQRARYDGCDALAGWISKTGDTAVRLAIGLMLAEHSEKLGGLGVLPPPQGSEELAVLNVRIEERHITGATLVMDFLMDHANYVFTGIVGGVASVGPDLGLARWLVLRSGGKVKISGRGDSIKQKVRRYRKANSQTIRTALEPFVKGGWLTPVSTNDADGPTEYVVSPIGADPRFKGRT